jgi:hypothetical protein
VGTTDCNKLVVGIIVAIVTTVGGVLFFIRIGRKHFDLSTEDHGETLPSHRLLHSGKARSVSPVVELSAKSIRFKFEKSEFARGKETMAASRVDVSDGGIDDGGLGGSPDLGKIGQKAGKVQKSTVECLSTLPLDSVMSSSTFSGISPPARFPLGIG